MNNRTPDPAGMDADAFHAGRRRWWLRALLGLTTLVVGGALSGVLIVALALALAYPNLPEDNWVWSPQGAINMHLPERWGRLRFHKP